MTPPFDISFVPLVLTTLEVASLLQVSDKLVRDLAQGRVLPGRKVGKDWRFNRDDVLAFVSGAQARPALTRKSK